MLQNIEKIITEYKRIANKPMHTWADQDFPSIVSIGNGEPIILSPKIEFGIKMVAQAFKMKFITTPAKARLHTNSEWELITRKEFCPLLYTIDLDADSKISAKTVYREMKIILLNRLKVKTTEKEYVFGCLLFLNTEVQPFTIGPVRFETRLNWLELRHQERAITSVIYKRIKEIWSNKSTRKRKQSIDIKEKDILDTVGCSHFICSVTIKGLARESGLEKALTAVRLAITSIALLFRTSSSYIQGMKLLFDNTEHGQHMLIFALGKLEYVENRLSTNSSCPSLLTGEWENKLSTEKKYFSVVRKVLRYTVSSTGKVSQNTMMGALAQSLLWYHQGCLESNSLMAIVKFSSSLEALTCGNNGRKDILKLIKAQLGIMNCNRFNYKGISMTVDEAVNKFYRDGRNKTVHGKNYELGKDWSDEANIAEFFAKSCLSKCINWVAKNPKSNDTADLSK